MMFDAALFERLNAAAQLAVIGTGVFSLSKVTEMVKHVPGDIVECGTYIGGSAIAMAITAPEKKVYCFDTFSGMPEVTEHDQHKAGDFSTTLETATKNVRPYANIWLIPGQFKHTIPGFNIPKISLLYLDCDLYESYKIALKQFWPLLSEGGICIAEDYPHESCKGAKKACDEFFGEGVMKFEEDFWMVKKHGS